MNPHPSRYSSQAEDARHEPMRAMARSSFCVMPHAPQPARVTSFVFGRSASRIRPLLNQEERDRLHCWAMLITVASSAAGTVLLLVSAF